MKKIFWIIAGIAAYLWFKNQNSSAAIVRPEQTTGIVLTPRQ